MIKTIEFGDKTVNFSTSFAWAFAYKSQFGQDPARVFMPAIQKALLLAANEEAENEDQETIKAIILYEELGFTGIVQIAWAMAKLCDKNLPDPMTWVLSFGDDFNALDLVTDLIPAAIESCFASKKFEAPSKKELMPVTEPELMAKG
jgi:hypothetical protein